MIRRAAGPVLAAAAAALPFAALAAGPADWEIRFPEAGSEIATLIAALHNHIVRIGGVIVLIVLGLLLFTAWRFRASRHPEASRVARAPVLEFGWTVGPVIVLGLIAVPSLAVLRYEGRLPPPELTVKATGYQWFWKYDYTDYPDDHVVFDSIMVPEQALQPGQPRLLTADNPLVLPVGKVVRFQITSGDVVHSFFVPSLGLQMYAVPGRLNETWVRIDRPGLYYGQCNQICGANHSFMPVTIDARADADYAAWLAEARTRFRADSATDVEPVAPAPAASTPPAAAPPAGQPGATP